MRYLLAALVLLMCPLSVGADWQATLEAQFDIVETFDQLQDWKPAGGASMGDVTSTTHMPKLLGGGDSQWMYFSSWTGTRQANNWIGTQSQVWRPDSPKALMIDYTSEGAGPSRFGLFFGDKQAANPELTGYQEMYMFYMVYIPDNAHPTDGNGVGPASYVQGNDYLYSGYYKFNTFNMGCTGGGQCAHPNEPSQNYSPYHIIPQMQQYPSNHQRLTYKNQFTQGGNSPSNIVQYYSIFSAQPILTGQWMGLEFHLKNVLDGSDPKTIYDVWVYDTDGTATQIATGLESYYTSQPITELWNHFFFGGNVSFTDSNNTLDVIHIIDDFIIDDARIGPTYFSTLASYSASNPAVTATDIANQAAGTTSVTPSATATDDVDVTACKWATTNITYPSMTNTMTEGGANLWMADANLSTSNGQTYTLYYGCTDAASNYGYDSDSFSVASTSGGAAEIQRTGNSRFSRTGGGVLLLRQ